MSLEEMTKIDNLKSWTSGVEVEWEAVQQLRNIDAVMAAQAELVDVVHTLKQVMCTKG